MSDNTVNRGKLFVYSGASGVGKGTIMKRILEEDKTTRLSISATTRAPRPGETHGKEYFFVSREEFDKMIEEDGFMEYATYCSNSYGTPKKAVEDMLSEGINVFLEIDVVGALNIIRDYPECVSIFILPPDFEVLEHRLRNRGTETEEQITSRLETAKKEITQADAYKYNVVNADLDKAVEDVLAIIRKETGRE
jgi:guanylate kinase